MCRNAVKKLINRSEIASNCYMRVMTFLLTANSDFRIKRKTTKKKKPNIIASDLLQTALSDLIINIVRTGFN